MWIRTATTLGMNKPAPRNPVVLSLLERVDFAAAAYAADCNESTRYDLANAERRLSDVERQVGVE